ncbi:MAG: DUF4263 domain-containing protein [Ignavibacteria bacterium]|nr:DUF4263 domain-containing protein [Ignavibacteria bacterium]
MDDYDYFKNKKAERIYLSRLLENKTYHKDESGEVKELVRPFRYLSKVIDSQESHQFIQDGKELCLRVTEGERQEIIAKFFQDTRGINVLQIQKYTLDSGMPHKTSFSFTGDEISKLYNFIRNVALLPIKGDSSAKIDDRFLEEITITSENFRKILHHNPGLLKEIVENDITEKDLVNLGYRKKQLQKFENLLNDPKYFEEEKAGLGNNKREEDVWQNFFESNTWIFGYGLNYIFNTQLDGKKLEQVVSGYTAFNSGKRVDALLKTRGIVSSLAFGEIKTHKTALLRTTSQPYRAECWSGSDELMGAISQIQKTVQKSMETIRTKTQVKDKVGNLTGEELFLYHPKSFLIIGKLDEFLGQNGINEDKFSSFELFRQNVLNPEIITFDELYERAKYIVQSDENKSK